MATPPPTSARSLFLKVPSENDVSKHRHGTFFFRSPEVFRNGFECIVVDSALKIRDDCCAFWCLFGGTSGVQIRLSEHERTGRRALNHKTSAQLLTVKRNSRCPFLTSLVPSERSASHQSRSTHTFEHRVTSPRVITTKSILTIATAQTDFTLFFPAGRHVQRPAGAGLDQPVPDRSCGIPLQHRLEHDREQVLPEGRGSAAAGERLAGGNPAAQHSHAKDRGA